MSYTKSDVPRSSVIHGRVVHSNVIGKLVDGITREELEEKFEESVDKKLK